MQIIDLIAANHDIIFTKIIVLFVVSRADMKVPGGSRERHSEEDDTNIQEDDVDIVGLGF